jgi:hypothetical protein
MVRKFNWTLCAVALAMVAAVLLVGDPPHAEPQFPTSTVLGTTVTAPTGATVTVGSNTLISGDALQASTLAVDSQATGDLLAASSDTAWARLADVAVGQVLSSGGVATLPAYTNEPALQAGTGTATAKPAGLVCQNAVSVVDSATQNTWYTTTCSVPANTLATDGDTLTVEAPNFLANNSNTKGFQVWYTLTTANCTGQTSGSACTTGCLIVSGTTSGSNQGLQQKVTISRTGSATEVGYGGSHTGGAIVATGYASCAIDTTANGQIVFGTRNTSAAAISSQGSFLNVWFSPR